jgi:2-keto-4-pentenoate hydratase/2-oxohepta-3-ene-1,7-dioic acid hydratase in catechol pathway
MKLRTASEGLLVFDQAVQTVERALNILASGDELQADTQELLDACSGDASVTADPARARLPFTPRSMRAFMVWDPHYTASARTLGQALLPASCRRGRERLRAPDAPDVPTLQAEAALRPHANHAAVLPDVWWPGFELELTCVLEHPIADATPAEAAAAVGGWSVPNDWSARDVQADDARNTRSSRS